jgi:vacuolar-type H+-ATPase subunit H
MSSPEARGDAYRLPEVDTLLDRVAELIEQARPMPLSTSVVINKEETLELVEEARNRLPEELRAARWLLKEREEFLARVQREGDDILDEARGQAERMVQRTEVVKAAEHRARQVVDDAETQARQMRHQVEDFCDQQLAGFQNSLDRIATAVDSGREKLQATLPADSDREQEDLSDVEGFSPEVDEGSGFFDQDEG